MQSVVTIDGQDYVVRRESGPFDSFVGVGVQIEHEGKIRRHAVKMQYEAGKSDEECVKAAKPLLDEWTKIVREGDAA